MHLLPAVLSVVGRALIVGIFLVSALLNKIPNFSGVAEVMAAEGVPLPKIMLGGAIALLVLGSASVLLGYKARVGAGMLLVFLVAATYFFHDFWNMPSERKGMEVTQFLKNASLMGTMLLIMANGVGSGSLDEMLARRQQDA